MWSSPVSRSDAASLFMVSSVLSFQIALAEFIRRFSRAAFIHGEQLGDSHEFESFCEKRIKNLRHRRNGRRGDVMGQNDRPRARARDNALRDDVRARSLLIERINVPQDDFVAEVVIHQYALPFRQLTIRRTHQLRFYPGGFLDQIFGPLKLASNIRVREFREIRMRPRVIADLMSFRDLLAENVRVLLDAFAEDKEGEFDVPLRCHLEQLGRVSRGGTIIKGHRDIWSIDVYLREGDLLSNTDVGQSSGRCNGFVLCASNRLQNEKEGYYEKRTAYHIT